MGKSDFGFGIFEKFFRAVLQNFSNLYYGLNWDLVINGVCASFGDKNDWEPPSWAESGYLMLAD